MYLPDNRCMDDVVEEALRAVRAMSDVDTVILFGSRAEGRATEHSDVDLFAFRSDGDYCLLETTALGRDVRCYVYNSAVLSTACSLPCFYVAFPGIPIYDPNKLGAEFLAKVERAIQSIPPSTPQIKEHIRHFYRSALDTAFLGTPKSDFMRLRLLTRGPDILFALNDFLYCGKKRALAVLRRDEPKVYEIFAKALSPAATKEDVTLWAQTVLYRKINLDLWNSDFTALKNRR